MYSYLAPLRDMRFVIEEVLQAGTDWKAMARFADLDYDTAAQVLEEAARFAGDVLAPLNAQGDREGCHWHDGQVSTPAGFADAYRAFVTAGWPSLACDPVHGGQGLPLLVKTAFDEMLSATNHAWMMYPGLLHGAYECLNAYGSDALKDRYLADLVSGRSLATMNLTEPQAGSDLSLIRTRAEPADDDTWLVSGNKVFISGGAHDWTDNILHLVLCRLPDAPAGSRGLSLVLAPKVLPDGRVNAIHCDGIEHKMGIKASATCAMRFERATAWLVGAPHRGLAALFVMMNAARLHVSLQGLGHLEMAQQNAQRYACERIQGRGQAIGRHAAVRRIIWTQRALCEGQRVLAYWTAHWLDQAQHHPLPDRREQAHQIVSVLTPVLKALLTDNGHRGADEALQVWGGYGYTRDCGLEQTVRDSRIAMIYEGTTEIQALDLIQRKVIEDSGSALRIVLAALEASLAAVRAVPQCHDLVRAYQQQRDALQRCIDEMPVRIQNDPGWSVRIADDFLRALGLTLLGWAWLRISEVSHGHEGDPWYDAKRASARFGLEWLLGEATWRWQRVMAPATALPELPPG